QNRSDARRPRAQTTRLGAHREILEIDTIEIQTVESRFHSYAVDFHFIRLCEEVFQLSTRGDLFVNFEEVCGRTRDRLPGLKREQWHQDFDTNLLVLDINKSISRRVTANAHILLVLFFRSGLGLSVVARRRPGRFIPIKRDRLYTFIGGNANSWL